MNKSLKTEGALAWLDRNLGNSLERAELARHKTYPNCAVRLDRLEFTASELSENLIIGKAGLRRTKKYILRPSSPAILSDIGASLGSAAQRAFTR